LYSSPQLAKKYLRYWIIASNGKGHGIHSPFVYDFVQNVLNDKNEYACYKKIEPVRNGLLQDQTIIEVDDFGAGSAVIKKNTRAVNRIAASSLKPRKYAQLLFRMVNYYKPQNIVELGTSFGITTAYLASGNKAANVFTLEGASAIAGIAKQNFTKLHLANIRLLFGSFEETLPSLFSAVKNIDFVFIDGNHRKEPTLAYFNQLISYSTTSAIFIFDDIHWSKEMEDAWEHIKHHPAVTLTIDLFFIGIVCINSNIKTRQHFVIRF